MMQIFHGIDLVEISSIERLLTEQEEHFLERCFLASEVNAAGSGIHKSARLAARFAAKEAVMKALGTGFSSGVGFLDIEIETTETGRPSIRLHGKAAHTAEELGISSWVLSTSHDGDYAVASAIGYRDSN